MKLATFGTFVMKLATFGTFVIRYNSLHSVPSVPPKFR